MTLEYQLKLQAYLDGELSSGERRQMETWLAEDPAARLLLAELTNIKTALAGFDTVVPLPESREFYWHKIDDEIKRQTLPHAFTNNPPALVWWRKFLIPAGAVAVLTIVTVMAAIQFNPAPKTASNTAKSRAHHFLENESPSEQTQGFTFRDQAAGMTVVWVSSASEEGFTEAGLIDNIQ